MDEILNIDYHTKILLKEALRRYKGPSEAYKHLKISKRTVFRYMQKFNITIDGKNATKVQRCSKINRFMPICVGANGHSKRNRSL